MSKARVSTSKDSKKSPVSILIIGAGNMGTALAHGLASAPIGDNMSLTLFDLKERDPAVFAADKRIREISAIAAKDISSSKVIVIATKPQDLKSVGKLLKGNIAPSALVISLLAAVTTDDVAKETGFSGAIVRAMPNIAATVQEAATAMCKNNKCNDNQMALAHEIFASVGTASWTKESLLDAVTGLSGSGPAYIYMVIEALTDGGVKMGLPRPLALELATQTVVGSGKLVQSSGLHPAILRDQVTTPGGTTISAIHELEERGLRAMLMQAVQTATERSKFLRESSAK